MAPRRCCCRVNCLIGEDNFNRDNSSDPGVRWRILSGTWAIDGNELSGIGKLATTFCHSPVHTFGSYVAEMLLVGMGDGTTSYWEVLLGDPSAPTHRVEVSHVHGTSMGTLKLFAGSGLVHSETYSGMTSDSILQVCYAPGLMVSAFLGGRIPHIDACDGSIGAPCFEIAGGVNVGGFSFAEGVFDNWTYTVHYLDNQNCPACSCFCFRTYLDEDGNPANDYSCLPGTVTLTFESVGAEVAVMPDILLFQSLGNPSAPWPSKTEAWNSNIYNCGLPVGASFAFRLLCGIPIEGMQLAPLSPGYDLSEGGNIVWEWTTGDRPTRSFRPASESTSTCDPLSLVFPEIKVRSAFPGPGCGMNGEYQPYCTDLNTNCYANVPDIRFIPRIIV